ncbi:hypothetical protein THAOC_17532, partial [Thalassiosira oceanica]
RGGRPVGHGDGPAPGLRREALGTVSGTRARRRGEDAELVGGDDGPAPVARGPDRVRVAFPAAGRPARRTLRERGVGRDVALPGPRRPRPSLHEAPPLRRGVLGRDVGPVAEGRRGTTHVPPPREGVRGGRPVRPDRHALERRRRRRVGSVRNGRGEGAGVGPPEKEGGDGTGAEQALRVAEDERGRHREREAPGVVMIFLNDLFLPKSS